MANTASLASIPSHVPKGLVFDIDMYNIPGLINREAEDIHAAWKEIQDNFPPVFWTPFYGGHWIATRYKEIEQICRDYNAFSSTESAIPKGVFPRLIPVQLDPPDHGRYRKLMMPGFTPAALAQVTDRARSMAVQIIAELQPRGKCEFVGEFAGVMPIIAFLNLMNLPESDYQYLSNLAKVFLVPADPDAPAAWAALSDYVRNQIEIRRRNPCDDLISSMMAGAIEGRPLKDEEAFSMVLLLMAGGLDTVALMTSFAACFLAQHPQHCRELIDHPERIQTAVEEIARRFGTSNLGRIVREDIDLGGASLKAGEMIVCIFPLAGLDETVNEFPLKVDFTRERPRHLAFGTGPHMCIGKNLAKREIGIFLEEWLKRIPSFRLAEGTRPRMTTGVVNHISELHLEWDVK